MTLRMSKNVVALEPGEVAPEYLCLWTASAYMPTQAEAKRWLAQNSGQHTWWRTGWAFMEPRGKVLKNRVYITAPEDVIDRFIIPPANEYGEVFP